MHHHKQFQKSYLQCSDVSGSADQHVPFGVLRVDVSAIVGQVPQRFCAHLVFTLVQVVQADLVRLREIQECHL